MGNGGFSLSVSNRGSDVVIGGSGVLDIAGMASLRAALEDSCKSEGAAVMLDLTGVSRIDPETVVLLVESGDFCRGIGIVLTLSVSPDVLAVLNAAGYSGELLPLTS